MGNRQQQQTLTSKVFDKAPVKGINADKFTASTGKLIDSKDAFANAEPVTGREAIEEYVSGFLSAVASTKHSTDSSRAVVSRGATTLYWAGRCLYAREDGSELDVPFFNMLVLDGDGKVVKYQVYCDNHELFAAQAGEGAD